MSPEELSDVVLKCTSGQLDALAVRLSLDAGALPGPGAIGNTYAKTILDLIKQKPDGWAKLEAALKKTENLKGGEIVPNGHKNDILAKTWPLLAISFLVMVALVVANALLNPFLHDQPPQNYSEKSLGLTTVLSQDALRPEVIPSGNKDQERLRQIIREGKYSSAVSGAPVDKHHQCLVSLSEPFGHDYKLFPMNITINPKIELRKVDAYLVKGGITNSPFQFRLVTVHLPENKNHTGILDLEQATALESLLLISRVGTDRDDLELNNTSADYYLLTLTKR
jgi:hypothetical protein